MKKQVWISENETEWLFMLDPDSTSDIKNYVYLGEGEFNKNNILIINIKPKKIVDYLTIWTGLSKSRIKELLKSGAVAVGDSGSTHLNQLVKIDENYDCFQFKPGMIIKVGKRTFFELKE